MKSLKSNLFKFDDGVKPNNYFASTEGEIELWTLEFRDRPKVVLRMPYPQAPMVRIAHLMRDNPKLAYLKQWTSCRKPTQDEVLWYVQRHPELKIVVDTNRIKTLN